MIGHRMSTSTTPPRKKVDAFSLCLWKKKCAVLLRPMMKAKPARNSTCRWPESYSHTMCGEACLHFCFYPCLIHINYAWEVEPANLVKECCCLSSTANEIAPLPLHAPEATCWLAGIVLSTHTLNRQSGRIHLIWLTVIWIRIRDSTFKYANRKTL